MTATPSPTKPRRSDVFPATQLTWIDHHLDEGPEGRGAINAHIMSIYRWPLSVYFMGTRDRWLGEPDEVINGFFADRLAKPNFLDDWRASGLHLRHWLINAFCFYLRELRRDQARRQTDGVMPSDEVVFQGNTRDLDRAFVAGLVARALQAAEQTCRRQGLAAHWQVFFDHFVQGRPYDQFVADLGIDAARAVVMARTAKKKFQDAVRDLVSKDHPSGDIDDEIRSLLEGH